MRKKIKFYKMLVAEICETLCTICLVFASDREHGKYREIFLSHYTQLKKISETLRGVKNE